MQLGPIKSSHYIEAIDSLFGWTVFVKGSVVLKSDGIVMQVCKQGSITGHIITEHVQAT